MGDSAALDFAISVGYLRKRLAYCGFQFLEREESAGSWSENIYEPI